MSATVHGYGGALRFVYKDAADIGAWTLTLEPRLPRSYEFRASASERAEYWLSQRPLTLSLEVGGVTWEWSGVEPVWAGEELTVSGLGFPTVVHWAG